VKISVLLKTTGLWLSGVLFAVEIFGEILLILSYFIRAMRDYIANTFFLNPNIIGNLVSEFLILTHLIIGIIFLSQLFNKSTSFHLKSYAWIYMMSVSIFLGFFVRYISNSYKIEKILLFDLNIIAIFISLTFIFFFQNAYKNVAKGNYSYMMFTLLTIGSYIFYLTNIAPSWEYYRIVFW
tara:strand:- start:256 stop:798 length:543 start_codon:yes stop_codon:yes gene_type:complete